MGTEPDGRVMWQRDGRTFHSLGERAVTGTDR